MQSPVMTSAKPREEVGMEQDSANLLTNLATRGAPTYTPKLVTLAWLRAYIIGYYVVSLLAVYHHAAWLVPAALLVPRIFQQEHYVHHMRPKALDLPVRLMFFFDAPFSLGFDETAAVHDTHHRFSCDPEKDMQYSIIAGEPYMGLEPWLRNFFQPELDVYNYAIYHKRPVHKLDFVARIALFIAAAVFLPSTWWLYVVLPTRIQRAQFYFFAFHFQHRDGKTILPDGKNMELSWWARPILSFINGHENILAMEYHIVHHLYPAQPVEEHADYYPPMCRDTPHPEECPHRADWHFPSLQKLPTADQKNKKE